MNRMKQLIAQIVLVTFITTNIFLQFGNSVHAAGKVRSPQQSRIYGLYADTRPAEKDVKDTPKGALWCPNEPPVGAKINKSNDWLDNPVTIDDARIAYYSRHGGRNGFFTNQDISVMDIPEMVVLAKLFEEAKAAGDKLMMCVYHQRYMNLRNNIEMYYEKTTDAKTKKVTVTIHGQYKDSFDATFGGKYDMKKDKRYTMAMIQATGVYAGPSLFAAALMGRRDFEVAMREGMGKSLKYNTPADSSKDFTKLKNGQGWKDDNGNTWKKDMKHKDHYDISDSKGNKIREVDFKGNEIWPNGPKNKNKKP